MAHEYIARIIAFDPGSLVTGYAVFDQFNGMELSLVKSGTIKLKKGEPIQDRLPSLFQAARVIRGQWSADQFNKTEFAIEAGYATGPKQSKKSMLVLAEARGTIIASIGYHSNVFFYPPSTVKAAATSSGKASKDMVARCMAARFKTGGIIRADESDAIAIGYAHSVLVEREQEEE